MNNMDHDLDVMPIPEQLILVRNTVEAMAVNMALLSMMFPRLKAAGESSVFKPDEGKEFVSLVERTKELLGMAIEHLPNNVKGCR